MGKDVYGRRLRGGMVGGAAGAFIRPVHRMAATVDDGVAGLAFIATVLESSKSDRKWTKAKA